MTSRTQISGHAAAASKSWNCIPLPEHLADLPDKPFKGMSIKTLIETPPHLIAHILRTKANKGLQVLSPKATPMLATVERIDPWVREPGHLVVTTQASPTASWPTVDGTSVDGLFAREPIRSKGADAPQVTRTKTRPIGKAIPMNAAADPVSRAIVRSASLIDVQRRTDVAGDADVLAEVLDTAWELPPGTFGTLAPLVLASSQDLLRTAISSDHNAPDALMPIQRKKVIHVHGGLADRSLFGPHMAMDWARQRAIARSIFHLSSTLEGMDLTPTTRTYAAGDMRAPIHSSERDKHLVFQPVYGSVMSVDPDGFRFERPADVPPRFAKCLGITPPNPVLTDAELESALSRMVEGGLPKVAAETVAEAFRMNTITRLVAGDSEGRPAIIRGTDAAKVARPKSSALAIAHAEVTYHLETRLARGATSGRVLRSRIFAIMEAVDAVELMPVFKTISVLKAEAVRLDISLRPLGLIRKLASRLSHTLGALVVRSLAVEAERMGETLEDWFLAALEVVPLPIRPKECSTLGWSVVAIWNMWSATTGKWEGALRRASHRELVSLANAKMRPRWVQIGLRTPDAPERAARAALAACQELYAPYYERMYDYYAMISSASPKLLPLGVGKVSRPAFASADRAMSSIFLYLGACLWQFRGRHLRSAYIERLPMTAADPPGTVRSIKMVDYKLAIVVAPNKAYEAMRVAYERVYWEESMPVIPPCARGKVEDAFLTWPEPFFEYTDELGEGDLEDLRLARYVMAPSRMATDLERMYDEVVLEVANAAICTAQAMPVDIEPGEDTGLLKVEDVAVTTPKPSVTLEDLDPDPEGLAGEDSAQVAALEGAELVGGGAAAGMARYIEKLTTGGDSGWIWIRRIYGDGCDELIMDMEDMATEDEVDEVMNSDYETEAEFKAAVDRLYGEDLDADPEETTTVNALAL